MQRTPKGVYPAWMDETNIINQVLHEIVSHGGKLPLSFILNEAIDETTRKRMSAIIETMRTERLIVSPLEGSADYLEIDIEGSRAVHIGYKKYKKIKKWDSTLAFLNRFSLLFLMAAVLGALVFLVYLVLHYFKVV